MSDGLEPEVNLVDQLSAALNPVSETPPVAEVATPTTLVEPSGGHPAWQEILNNVPEMLHEKLIPTLQAWDKGVQEKLTSVHSKYDPYKTFVDGNTPVADITTGLQIVQLLNEDPARFYNHMREFYNLGDSEQGQSSQQKVEETFDLGDLPGEVDLTSNPQFKKLQEMQQQMLAQQESLLAEQGKKEAEIWLDTKHHQISEVLKEKHAIPLDDKAWQFILNQAAVESQTTGDNETALVNATNAFVTLVSQYRSPVANASAPPVMTPNGSVPASTFDATKLGSDDRKKLFAQMLTQGLKGQ